VACLAEPSRHRRTKRTCSKNGRNANVRHEHSLL
jgi:hypothetical protein